MNSFSWWWSPAPSLLYNFPILPIILNKSHLNCSKDEVMLIDQSKPIMYKNADLLQGYLQQMHLAWIKMGEGSKHFKTLGAGNVECVLKWRQVMGTGKSPETNILTQTFQSASTKTRVISYGHFINNNYCLSTVQTCDFTRALHKRITRLKY